MVPASLFVWRSIRDGGVHARDRRLALRRRRRPAIVFFTFVIHVECICDSYLIHIEFV